ncbi:AAA family ATPase [Mycobacterium sp. NPDC050853]|uniref:AAA family ATPase n=1 Tax=Mycobacterium sp. NPDC050853 TaxID=3155160 RepID=UPI0034055207
MTLTVRKPTGVVPFPLVLIEGPEKSGKTYAAAQFTASDKIGQAYWLDLGEDAADEYSVIPGAEYLIIEHDGTWRDIVHQVEEVAKLAKAAHAADEPPVVLVIDSMTNEWTFLKDWADQRARNTPSNRAKLAKDPDAEIKPSMNFWNDVSERHYQLMRTLVSFPGIVIMTARGKEVAEVEDGKPTGKRDYRVEGQKDLAYEATAWVQLSRERPPVVVGVRSPTYGVRPGVDQPKPVKDFSLEWLIFDVMKPGMSPRKTTPLQASDVPPAQQMKEQLRALLEGRGIDLKSAGKWFNDEYGADLNSSTDLEQLEATIDHFEAMERSAA